MMSSLQFKSRRRLSHTFSLKDREEFAMTARAQDHDEIGRIVKETSTHLIDEKSIDDEQAQKQRGEIVRALTERKGRVGGEDGAARTPAAKSLRHSFSA
jgi:hypothetical protein